MIRDKVIMFCSRWPDQWVSLIPFPPLKPSLVNWGSSWKPNNTTDITRQKLRTVRQSRKSYMLVYLEQQRFKACLRRCQVVQNRVLFENVLGMRMLLLSGSEASNTCSNMHTIPFSPDMAGPQGTFCPFSSVFTTLPIFSLVKKHELQSLHKKKITVQKENINSLTVARTMNTQHRHKSKISEKLGRCGRQNMLWLHLKIWDWDWIFSRAVKAISSLGVCSPWAYCPILIKKCFRKC